MATTEDHETEVDDRPGFAERFLCSYFRSKDIAVPTPEEYQQALAALAHFEATYPKKTVH